MGRTWIMKNRGSFWYCDQFLLEQLTLCLYKWIWLRDRKLSLICKNKPSGGKEWSIYAKVESKQMRTQNCFDSNLAYMDHSLPPLGLFLQINLNFLSLSQTHLLRHKESCSKRNWSTISKTPPFSHSQPFSLQEANFWQKRQ